MRETFLSVQNQTYLNIEIIAVDDGSTDSTAQIIEKTACTDRRIRVFRQTNKGVAEARNRGIAESRGELIAPIDADDVWDPTNLALQVEALQSNGPRAGVSYAWFLTINENSVFTGLGPETRITCRRSVWRAQMRGNFIGNASSTVMRREAVEEVGGYDPSLRARGAEGCEDQALYTRLAETWDFVAVPRYLIAYRRHPWCMSCDEERMTHSQLLVLADLRERYKSLPNYWYGRAIADVLEGSLTNALRDGDWRKAAMILEGSRKRSSWAFFRLTGLRLPIRAGQFAFRRLTARKAPSKPAAMVVDQFWSKRNARGDMRPLQSESLAAPLSSTEI